ncbi:MAG TPA: 3'(2'),5'-bisphosphate nucleotidase [Leucothrix mucor]|nr:3'(2'),5'-bisphosphate nucleotidase [Leucothrix mucor]
MINNDLKELLPKLLPDVKRIALEAGEKIMVIFNRGFEVEYKDDESPVTEADLAANAHIIDELRKLAGDFPILTEEEAALSFEERSKWETYWLVDPLDGTIEFVNRRDGFTVNIALIHKHKSVLGVIYAPVFDTSYYAAKGHGAHKDSKDTQGKKITVRALPDKPMVAVSRSHSKGDLLKYLESIGEHELIQTGSSLKMCYVAEGVADIYPRLWWTSEWDTGAAHCIVDEAGGSLVKTDMSPLLYNTKDSLLNPFFFTIGGNDHDWMQYLPEADA